MKKATRRRAGDEMLGEYDFRGGVRGKYARRFDEGTNLIVLAPDLAGLFPDSKAVNAALRAYVGQGAGQTRRRPNGRKRVTSGGRKR